MKLSELKTGERGVIVKVLGHGGFRKRSGNGVRKKSKHRKRKSGEPGGMSGKRNKKRQRR